MYWIINDNIEFKPGEKKLISANNPEMNVTLTTPASRCLQLLLEASPEIVLQQDFFKKVWEEEGMLVPTNTLYQNISIIRRGLRAVGETDRRLIATIPRKGFQIDSNVKISRQKNISMISDVAENITTGDPVSEDAQQINALGDMLPAKHNSLSLNEKDQQQEKTWRPGWYISALVMFTAFVAGLLLTYSLLYFNDKPGFFSDYILMEKENGCYFYTKDDALDNDSSYQKNKRLIINSGLNCKHYPWIYFPTSKTSPTLAAMVCKNKFTTTSTPGCISLYFRGVNND